MTRPAPTAVNVLELFAGAGGATLGISRALPGAEHYAVERDPEAAAVWRAAFPDHTMDERDVEEWLAENGEWLPRTAFMLPDLIWSSPPCQMHSRAGNGTGYDGWPATFAAIRRLQPQYVIIENVVGAPAEAWAAELRLAGYDADVWRLDAADFGVPQHRKRLFVVAERRDGGVRWFSRPAPAPTHGPGRALPWVTIREALQMPGWVGAGGKGHRRARDITEEPAATVKSHDSGGERTNHLFVRAVGGGHNPHRAGDRRTERDPTDEPSTTAASWFHPLDPDRKEVTYPPGWGRAATEPERLDRPSPCVAASEEKGTNYRRDGSGPEGGPPRASDALFLATGRRRATPFENARLQGFPDDFPFHVAKTKKARYKAVGNAVPPTLAEVVVRTLVR